MPPLGRVSSQGVQSALLAGDQKAATVQLIRGECEAAHVRVTISHRVSSNS